MRRVVAFVIAAACACAASVGLAHYASITWSEVTVHADRTIDYRLQVPLEDLSEALALDSHRAATVAEVRGGRDRLFAYFLPKLQLSAGGQPCPAVPQGIDIVEAGELRAELRFRASCPGAAHAITLAYRVFFEHDPRHLGIYVVRYPGGELTGELSRARPTLSIMLGEPIQYPSSQTHHGAIWVVLLLTSAFVAWVTLRG